MAQKLGNGGNGQEQYDPNTGRYISSSSTTTVNSTAQNNNNITEIPYKVNPIKGITNSDVNNYIASHPNARVPGVIAAAAAIGKYEKLEPQITQELKDATENAGGMLVGLDFRMKSLSSAVDRMEKNGSGKGAAFDVDKALYGVKDILRYTACFEDSKFEQGIQGVVSSITPKYQLGRVLNRMHDGSLYKGINCLFTDGKGHVFELQFHTPESLKAKDGLIVDLKNQKIYKDDSLESSHKYYEQTREVKTRAKNGQATAQEIADSKANIPKLAALWAKVPNHSKVNLFKYIRRKV